VDEFEGHDLDLTYITDRIIAMGMPSSGSAALFFNNVNEISLFCKKYHPGQCRIFNLTENLYEYPALGDVAVCHTGWIDHHAPPLGHLVNLIQRLSDYLSSSPTNVAMIHCKAGRSRSGTVIACYLLNSQLATYPHDAVLMFNIRRSLNPSLKLPSQIRIVNYFFELLQRYGGLKEMINCDLILNPPTFMLTAITISPTPKLGISHSGFTPYIEIYDKNKLLSSDTDPIWKFQSDRKFVPSDEDVILNPNVNLAGDILMVFNHTSFATFGDTHHKHHSFFKLQLHTSFIEEEVLTFTSNELDDVACDAPLTTPILLILNLKRLLK